MKKVSELSKEVCAKRLSVMKSMTDEMSNDTERLHVYISKGNTKMGDIPSVSLRPILDCINCKFCSRACYDIKTDCRFNNVMRTRANNAAILRTEPDRYFSEISEACKKFAAFRWHVGGDIVSAEYLEGMVKVAKENKHCEFLTYTKSFDIVNDYIKANGPLPKNMHMRYSEWPGQTTPNPYDMPTFTPVTADELARVDKRKVYVCDRNCTRCLLHKCGCWGKKNVVNEFH